MIAEPLRRRRRCAISGERSGGGVLDCRGTHIIADLYGCSGLDDLPLIDAALRDATDAIGATLIDLRLHPFGPGQGITGVALLAESHISIHSWPEHGYAAVDVFVCGSAADPAAAIRLLCHRLHAGRSEISYLQRGCALAETKSNHDAKVESPAEIESQSF